MDIIFSALRETTSILNTDKVLVLLWLYTDIVDA